MISSVESILAGSSANLSFIRNRSPTHNLGTVPRVDILHAHDVQRQVGHPGALIDKLVERPRILDALNGDVDVGYHLELFGTQERAPLVDARRAVLFGYVRDDPRCIRLRPLEPLSRRALLGRPCLAGNRV